MAGLASMRALGRIRWGYGAGAGAVAVSALAARRYSCIVLDHPPVSAPKAVQPRWKSVDELSDAEKQEIRQLRGEDPKQWTCTTLARKFNTGPKEVATVAPLDEVARQQKLVEHVLAIKPSKNWKGKQHYRRVKDLQRAHMKTLANQTASS